MSEQHDDRVVEELGAHYRMMRRIRSMEEEILRLRLAGDVVGSVHLCIGQEAIYAGGAYVLDPAIDAVFPTYRGHGWALAMGVPMVGILAELLGREEGISGGRGGSAYFTAPRFGMYGENSIVGAAAPIAMGAALAAHFDGSKRISVASFGEGALNQGAVHEAMNFAAVRSLPVIYIVENNSYSEMTPTADMVRDDRLFKRAAMYGFTGARVDGNDPIAMADAMAKAIGVVRSGRGPVLLEAMTARLVGHYIGDAQAYRPAGEVERDQRNEPLSASAMRLRLLGVTQQQIDVWDAAVRDEVESASSSALAAAPADPRTVRDHLYA